MSDPPNKNNYKMLVVVLRVINVRTDEVIRETIRAIDGAERRKWISDTVLWACLNGCYVEVVNQEHDTMLNDK